MGTVTQRTATRNPTDTMAATTLRAATTHAATIVTDRPLAQRDAGGLRWRVQLL